MSAFRRRPKGSWTAASSCRRHRCFRCIKESELRWPAPPRNGQVICFALAHDPTRSRGARSCRNRRRARRAERAAASPRPSRHSRSARQGHPRRSWSESTPRRRAARLRPPRPWRRGSRPPGFPSGGRARADAGGAPERGNLVARLRGRGREADAAARAPRRRRRAARGLDARSVHAARGDGYFYGRGTADDKAMAAIWVATLIRCEARRLDARSRPRARAHGRRGGRRPNTAWTGCSSTSARSIDAEFALNEGGGGGSKRASRPVAHVQASEKVYQSFALRVTNSGGHSSLPRADNAIYQLAAALGGSRGTCFRSPERDHARFFERMAGSSRRPVAAAMRAVLANGRRRGRRAAVGATAVQRAAAHDVRRDAARGRARGQRAAAARARERELPHAAGRRLGGRAAALARVVADARHRGGRCGRAIRRRRPRSSPAARPDRARHDASVARRAGHPDDVHRRDRRRPAQAGIPTYGVTGCSPTARTNAHGRDERFAGTSFFDGLEFGYRLVKRLTGGS